ncbi:hypothetical protein QQ045_032078 [Rhodiola kirilowii]
MDADDIIHHAAGFYPWTQVCNVEVDLSLLTAVVERWRPETHTFHFNDGETTITLQDVSLLTGLPIDGAPVTGNSQLKFEEVSVRLLGLYPDCFNKSPAIAKRSWFMNHLAEIPDDADEETLKKYARAYLLTLISTLFGDKSGDAVDDYGGREEAYDDTRAEEHMEVDDTHAEEQMDDHNRPSSSSQSVRRGERQRGESRWSFIRNLPQMMSRRGRGGR